MRAGYRKGIDTERESETKESTSPARTNAIHGFGFPTIDLQKKTEKEKEKQSLKDALRPWTI